MTWEKLKHIFRREGTGAPPASGINWVEAADNPWGVRVLDVRPVTQTMLSASSDPQQAANVTSLGQDDGTDFIGREPPITRSVETHLLFPIDRFLFDGVLFIPTEMEHKWALFYHRGEIICVRSWLRQVQAVARVEPHHDHVDVTNIRGTFVAEDEAPEFTIRVLDYLLRSHALDSVYPAPLPVGWGKGSRAAAMWCMSMFGNRALFATPHQIPRRDPDRVLRTHSLLHIAVALGDVPKIEKLLATGLPIELLARDGLAPLHWALDHDDTSMLSFLLGRGSPVDVRSAEGATPLMNAVQSASLEKATFLLDHGAEVNAHDHRGFTALHRAAEMGHLDLVKLLLDRGASPSPEAEGHTPRSLAEARKRTEIVALLRKYSSRSG